MIGHESQWGFLLAAAEQDALAHAYLFLGPQHVGKRFVADRFAAFLLCQAGQAATAGLFAGAATNSKSGVSPTASGPCGSCGSCRALEKGVHQDFLLIERAEDEQTISIERMREFLGRLRQSPALSKRKVAIVDGAQDMNMAAANAFLKQLEEPTPSTTIILVAHDQRRLLPTIMSRCQVLEFYRVPGEHDLANDPLWLASGGLPGVYEQWKRAPSLAQERADESARFWELFRMSAGERLALLEHFFKQKKQSHAQLKQEWNERLAVWQGSVRDALCAERPAIAPTRVVELYDELQRIRDGLAQNINVRAHVEAFLVTLT